LIIRQRAETKGDIGYHEILQSLTEKQLVKDLDNGY
jgi:hypothetical protein